MNPFLKLSGPPKPPIGQTGKSPVLVEPMISGNLEDHLMPNPSIPHLLIKIKRKGKLDTLTVHPESMEWILSTEGADMLKFTVPDPDYTLIDHPLLVEDFKTEVEFRYGYNTNMSEVGHMRYFNQRPEFPENGPVKTTIVCYDLSVFLNFEIRGKTLEEAERIGVKDIIAANLRDAEEQFGIRLKPVYDNGSGECEFENTYYRVGRPHGSLMSHFADLRKIAKVKNVPDETLCEVFVYNDELHFHPPSRRLDPQGAYAYFSEHPGARLLSFSPQTDLQYTPRPVNTATVDADSGEIEGREADGKGTEARPTHAKARTSGVRGDTTIVPGKGGDTPEQAQRNVINKTYTVKGDEGDNLMGILEKFPGSNWQMFLDANGITDPDNYELTPGQTLTIPIPQSEEKVETTESATEAVSTHLAYESRALNAQATILGNPRLRAGWPVDIFNVGLKYEGRWYVRECTHLFGSDGYKVNFSLTREGINYGDGIENAGNATPAYEPAAPVDPAEAKKPTVTTDGVTGVTR